jgi:L-ascorbate metabolism protein UlaG (beta-lactamase superfamily)
MDPYEPNAFDGKVKFGLYEGPVDVLVSTHDHKDHFYVDPVFGTPVIVRESKETAGIKFEGIQVPHDPEGGKLRGMVTSFVFEIDGIRLCHLGDIGIVPDKDLASKFGRVDILLLPVGGVFTIDPAEAVETAKVINPQAIIPMHYKHPKIGFPLASRDDFLKLAPWPVIDLKDKSLIPTPDNQPEDTVVVLMDPIL